MHKSSMEEMKKVLDELAPKFEGRFVKVLDIGSRAINSTQSYKSLMRTGWSYLGYDIEPGDNVNLWGLPNTIPIADNTFNIVISGQCIEHSPEPWTIIQSAMRVVRWGGFVCIIAPHTFKYHTEGGEDCFRFWPKGLEGLFRTVCVKHTILKSYKNAVDSVIVVRKDET